MGALTFMDIRHEFVRLIKAANIPGVLGKVFESRSERGWPAEGPFISVYTNSHSFDDQATSPVIYKVETTVVVDIIVQGPVFQVTASGRTRIDVDDQMDQLSNYVLNSIFYAPAPSSGPLNIGVDHFVRLSSVSNTLNGEGETPRACQRITFAVTWDCPMPDGGPDMDFQKIHNELDVSGSDGANKMVWEINAGT